MWDVVLDALLDTLKLFPFLFLLYVCIELLEHRTQVGKPNRALNGKVAPLIGAATGLVPMCGFSVMAAKLYRHRHITLGTLIAAFIATSDEAFIVLILSEMPVLDKVYSVLAFCGLKIFLGAVAGFLLDFVAAQKSAPMLTPLPPPHEHSHDDEHSHDHEHGCEGDHGHDHEECEEFSACEHKHKHGKREAVSLYLLSPLLHALKIAAFILVCNLAFGFLFYGIGAGDAELGEERTVEFLQGAGYWYQPALCCLIGLVPNCASSVVLAETFAIGGIAFGSCLTGLMVNAGLGYLVLLRDVKLWKQNLCIILSIALFSIAAGYAVNAVALSAGL